jgi:hypothetical protein
MQAVSRTRFLQALERQASKRGFATDVHLAAHSANYSVALVSEDAVLRITFVLTTEQEISAVTYRSMIRRIDSFLARLDLSEAQVRFGENARALVLEMISNAGEMSSAGSKATSTPSSAASLQAASGRRIPTTGAQAQREWYIENVNCLTREEVQNLAAVRAPQSLLALELGAQSYFPAFQFDDGKPRQIVSEILRIFRGKRSAWQAAFWFVSANGWLDGATPAQQLDDAQAVKQAAYREVNALIA